MQADTAQTVLESSTNLSTGYARIAAGLLQGLGVYLLHLAVVSKAWPATSPLLFLPLLMACVLLPVLLISGLGHLQGRKLAAWLALAALAVVAFALHDAWRNAGAPGYAGPEGQVRLPSALVSVFSAAFCFIAHSMVKAGAQDERWLASYATYFETAWKLFIQCAFSAMFVGATWAMLALGSELFMLVKLSFLHTLLGKAWFIAPVMCFAFACAMHITDVRPAIVRGIRTLLLVLMSWLLPVTVLLLGGFLCTLPFTGLDALWKTGHATAVLLGADAMLVVLINAAYQNGEVERSVAPLVRLAARVGAMLLLPVMAIAVYALALRVGDYGWSSDRIIAAACLLVGTFYAVGYAFGAWRRDAWLPTLATTNVGAACLVLAVLFALFTPLADPARISVNSQMARLESGAVKADKFDYEYLRFEGARYGRAALESLKLAGGPDGPQKRAGAAAALATDYRSWRAPAEMAVAVDISTNLAVWPQGSRLPDGFPLRSWTARNLHGALAPRCLREQGAHCDAFLLDLTGDGKPEVVVVGTELSDSSAVLGEQGGKWEQVGSLPYALAGCAPLLAKLKAGEVRAVAKPMMDLEVGGQRIVANPTRLERTKLCSATPEPLPH
ncbi:DUF4153 domain-containing protein [Pseudoduganella aquatica]|uniref:DUF4153 domain-containing protein n=1 Tax=Pseudoduganella aquatica TaxID=2660641 RepID=A0A7X4HCN5_9BURK|nr:DUF4153 domain-containing protein [Pseudoduganella aquatica]MYN08733.1 DUF4153 domain-containing protein [Pseudoduganella aquatica]